MKTKIRNKLANEKKKIEKQLKSTVNQEREKPMFSDSTITYEMAERTHAIAHGGIGAIHQMVGHVGLAKQIDKRLHLLQIHKPYHESDHVLNLAYNPLCGGRVIEDIELRRNDSVYLDALGAESIFFLNFQKRKVPIKVCKQVKRTDNIAKGLVVEQYSHNNHNSKKTEEKVECIFLVYSDRKYVIY